MFTMLSAIWNYKTKMVFNNHRSDQVIVIEKTNMYHFMIV